MEYIYQNKKVYYEISGDGPPLILLHGWGSNVSTFIYLSNSLKHNYTVITIDLPGFGKSEEPFAFYTLDDYYNLITSFVIDLNITKPVILGHSFGGRIAIKYASSNTNLSKLILIDSAGLKPPKRLRTKIKILTYKIKKLYYKTTKNIIKYNLLIENSGSSDYKEASPLMKQTLISTVNEHLDHLLEKIKVPTLIIWGKDDKVTPVKHAKKLNNKIESSSLIIIEGAGHFAYLDAKRYTSKLIRNFLESDK